MTAIEEDKTPYEIGMPNLSHLKVFGCMAYAFVPDALRQKLDKKAEKLRFVSYSRNSKGYWLLDEKTQKVVVRRDISFNETDFGYSSTNPNTEAKEIVEVNLTEIEEGRQEEDTPRHSARQRQPPVRYGLDEYADMATAADHVHHFAYIVCQIVEPKTMQEALASDQAQKGKAAADLDKKAEKLRFVGYSRNSKGYQLLVEKTQNIMVW